ncbi:MAG: shikimate kinase [Oscillospiraceae bacterium]|nr:shikimate kinase [Oscillospiraceae bacterium]
MIERIVLCGFMGSGKSTVGKALSEKLGWELIDTDEFIEAQQNMSIPQIFAAKGEASFREMEHHAAKLLADKKNCIISTGGQLMTVERNAELYRGSESLVIHLDLDFPACYERIKNSDRPLVVKNTMQQLEEIFNQRSSLYRKAAKFSIPNNGDLYDTVNQIISKLNSHT